MKPSWTGRWTGSYGAFELTVGHDPDVPDGITVLDQVAAAGYAGIDLGPVGYLGSGERLGELLAERGLGLAGAYVELPYADHDALERTLPELDAILAVFDAVRSYLPGPPPRPTLAEAGSQARRNRPGRSARDPSLGFDADAWRRFAAGLARVIDRCRDRGYDRGRARHRRDTGPIPGPTRRGPACQRRPAAQLPAPARRMSATPPPLRIGIAGYGVMGKAHSYGYRVAPLLRRLPVTPVVTVMSGRDAGAVAAAARAYGVPETVTDWRELISPDDVDVVDICTPPGTHAQIATEAAAAGKAVLCEKPLALTYAEAAGALDAVTRAGVHNAVGFNYRRLPAIALMRRMIDEGAVGQVRLWRATWLSDEFADPATGTAGPHR